MLCSSCTVANGFAQKVQYFNSFFLLYSFLLLAHENIGMGRSNCVHHDCQRALNISFTTEKKRSFQSNQMIETVQFYTTDQIFNTKCFKIYIFPLLTSICHKMVS